MTRPPAAMSPRSPPRPGPTSAAPTTPTTPTNETMSTNTYPTIETIRIGQYGHECRYCGHAVAKDGPGYRHTTTGQYRCDPTSRALQEARLSDSLVRS